MAQAGKRKRKIDVRKKKKKIKKREATLGWRSCVVVVLLEDDVVQGCCQVKIR